MAKPNSTSIWLDDEAIAALEELRRQTGLSASGQIRRLIMQAARGRSEDDVMADVRLYVAALRDLVL
jgi:Ribbon-helix-helix protein, copG family